MLILGEPSYFGDNLKWLSDRKQFRDASVDLAYLDPPFNSNADYNVLFREPGGEVSQAQFHALRGSCLFGR
jgi:site-specific DNA-methyltransferase (adenine-specific)